MKLAAEAGFQNPVPRCRQRNDTAKIQTVNGSRVEIFLRHLQKKYYPSIVGLDRRNGRSDFIVLDGRIWYNQSAMTSEDFERSNRL